MRIRNIFFMLITAIFIYSPCHTAQTSSGFEDRLSKYPSSLYITGLGVSDSKETAQTVALSEISMFFNSRVDVQSVSARKFESDMTKQSYSESINETVNINSQAEFFGAVFDTWYNEREKKWYVIAFLKKSDTLNVFETKLSSEINKYNSLTSKIDSTKDYLSKLDLFAQGLTTGGVILRYIDYITVLAPSKSGNYDKTVDSINKLGSTYISERRNASFSFASTKAPVRIINTLKKIFETNGYVIKPKNGMFIIEINIDMPEEELPSGIFMRSSIEIAIEQSGENIFTYSKTLPRYGHITKIGAINKNCLEIEKELEKNFMSEFKESVKI